MNSQAIWDAHLLVMVKTILKITSPPKVIWKRYPHVGECALPLRVLSVAFTMHNKAEHYGSITELLRNVTELLRKYRFCASLIEFCSSLKSWHECSSLHCAVQFPRTLRNDGIVADNYGTLREH